MIFASTLGLRRITAEVVVNIADAPVPTHVFSVNARELGRWAPSRLISVARLGLETATPPGAAAAAAAGEQPAADAGAVACGPGVEEDAPFADDVSDEDDDRGVEPPPHAVTATATIRRMMLRDSRKWRVRSEDSQLCRGRVWGI
ncbi:MAG: hypothetical protein DLM64_13335 [Solirubrobacterales bacterium]|nr:MAG: hypothetical protein DLM64_13335 [Solirubrobacterales bacterium]